MISQAAQRNPPQLRLADVEDSAALCRNLNDIFTDYTQRIAELEKLSGVKVLPSVELKTGAIVAPGAAPFPKTIAWPGFTPVGLLLLSVKNMVNGYAPSALGTANCVKWEVRPGGTALTIHYIDGLLANVTYEVRLAAIRG
jgi:hypothetical protein